MNTLYKFTILNKPETDGEAFVFENSSGLREILVTVNGEEKRLTRQELEQKIQEAQESLAGLKRARELLGNT